MPAHSNTAKAISTLRWLSSLLLQVQTFMREMQRGDNFTPIEVLWVQKGDDDFYFAFGGCHRWEAHKRLQKPTIRAKLVKTTPASLSIYLGRDPYA